MLEDGETARRPFPSSLTLSRVLCVNRARMIVTRKGLHFVYYAPDCCNTTGVFILRKHHHHHQIRALFLLLSFLFVRSGRDRPVSRLSRSDKLYIVREGPTGSSAYYNYIAGRSTHSRSRIVPREGIGMTTLQRVSFTIPAGRPKMREGFPKIFPIRANFPLIIYCRRPTKVCQKNIFLSRSSPEILL